MTKLKPKQIDYIVETYKRVDSILETAKITGFSYKAVNNYVRDLSSKKKCSRNCRNPVLQIDLKTERIICEWFKPSMAARYLKINPSEICLALQGKVKQAGGFGWKYKEEKTED